MPPKKRWQPKRKSNPRYRADWFEGQKNTWRQVVKGIKEVLRYDPEKHFGANVHFRRYDPDKKVYVSDKHYWRYSEKEFGWGLNSQQIKILTTVVRSLYKDCTAPTRRVFKGFDRLWQFYHIILMLPAGHGEHRFSYRTDLAKRYKDIIAKMIQGLFPGYQLGFYLRDAKQTTDTRNPELHFHVLLSAMKIRKTDADSLEWFKSLDDRDKPYYALYFFQNPIVRSTEKMRELIEPVWREEIEAATRRKIRDDQEALVSVTKSERQKIDDSHAATKYINNQAQHTFRNIMAVTSQGYGKVRVVRKPQKGKQGTARVYSEREFVINFLIEPLQRLDIGYRARGNLATRAKFSPIIDAASKLAIPTVYQNEATKFISERPVREIRELSREFRKCVRAEDEKGIQRIISQLSTEQREGDWARIIAGRRPRRKRTEEELRGEEAFKLRMKRKAENKKNRKDDDDSDLMQLC